MDEKLKPCPFCGENVKIISRPADDMHGFWHGRMDGNNCPLRVGVFVHRVSRNEAIAIWNRRATNDS